MKTHTKESKNKEYIEEWSIKTLPKSELMTKVKRNRPQSTEQERREKLNAIELNNAGDLTREEKLKRMYNFK